MFDDLPFRPRLVGLLGSAGPGLIACACFAVAPPAYAEGQPSERNGEAEAPDPLVEAERLAALAFEAYQRGDVAEAIELYYKSYSSSPSAGVLYNLGRIHEQALEAPQQALEYYRRCVEDPLSAPEVQQRAQARIAALTGGSTAEPEPHGAPRGAPSTAEEQIGSSEPWTVTEIAGLSLAAGGLASLLVGAGFGISALGNAKTVEVQCDGNQCTREGLDAVETAARHADIATATMAAGAGLMAIGAVLWLMDPTQPFAEREWRTTAHWAPRASPTSVGAVLWGSF